MSTGQVEIHTCTGFDSLLTLRVFVPIENDLSIKEGGQHLSGTNLGRGDFEYVLVENYFASLARFYDADKDFTNTFFLPIA